MGRFYSVFNETNTVVYYPVAASASGIKKVYGILVNTSSFRVVEMDLQRHNQLLEDAKYTAPTPFSLALAVPCGESGASTMSGMMICEYFCRTRRYISPQWFGLA